ncbi:MAG TPA: hypothetical protein VMP67_11535 [Candidatus Limnocylindria bacterium]|nr:hypothetical protein [Candidatus Limnocylindria bacterium]
MEPEEHSHDQQARQPRTGGDVGGLGPVQIALALLVVFLGLLVLWVLWPLIGG